MQFRGGEDALFHCSEQNIAANLPWRNIGLGRGGLGIKRVDIGFGTRSLGMRRRVSATVTGCADNRLLVADTVVRRIPRSRHARHRCMLGP